jgi:arginyl-tRNA synthetase
VTPAHLAAAVLAAARAVFVTRGLDVSALPETATVDRPRDPGHGDYASTLALRLGRQVGVAPHELASALAGELSTRPGIRSVRVAGPGFLNIRLDAEVTGALARDIVLAGPEYGPTGDLAAKDVPEDLVADLGMDAARYALARRTAGSTVPIDIDRWTRADDHNPVYRVQYVAARTAGVARWAAELGLTRGDPDDFRPGLLCREQEHDLLTSLGQYSAVAREPQRVARCLEQIAGMYHRFDRACRVLPMGDELVTDLHRARLWLNDATRTALANGLGLLGVSAPERM